MVENYRLINQTTRFMRAGEARGAILKAEERIRKQPQRKEPNTSF